jgi:iron complex transport system ATP-binding protein
VGSEPGAVLRLEKLGFRYGEQPVLAGVDLDAAPGEIVGLLGPNGSGKSTIVKILSAVLRGYTGSVRIDDRELREIPRRELARLLAVVAQETSFTFGYTALEIVLMGRHPHLAGLAFEADRDVDLAHSALRSCGADALASRSIHELSSGERQRVVFARALAQEPRVLLLDEPTSYLDIRHQVELYDVVRELAHDQGRTVLTVLHDLNLAAEYCDRIYLLHCGQISAGGSTTDVLTYANLKRVFETEVYVDTNSLTGKLIVVPLSGNARRGLPSD